MARRMAGITLYYFPGSYCSNKASLALHEKGIKVTRQKVDIHSATGEQNEPWYMRMNPKGVVPVLKHDDKIICESESIVEYIDRNFEPAATLMPDQSTNEGKEVVRIRKLLDTLPFGLITYGILLHPKVSPKGIKPTAPFERDPEAIKKRMATNMAYMKKMMEQPENEDIREAYREKIEARESRKGAFSGPEPVIGAIDRTNGTFDELEEYLKTRGTENTDTWLVGPSFTAADITFAVLLQRLDMLGLDDRLFSKDKRPNISGYYQKVQQRKAFQQMVEEQMSDSGHH